MKGRRISVLLLCVLLTLCCASCKNAFSRPKTEVAQELPDMIMHKATYIFGEKDKRPLIMDADTITVYSGKMGRTILEKAFFVQEDEGLKGQCDSAEVNKDNTIAQLQGNVKLSKSTDDFEIECELLTWDDEEQTISSDGEVLVKYGNGTQLQAIGFLAKLNDNVYEFGQIVEGRYTDED